jgi:hypothetical protein
VFLPIIFVKAELFWVANCPDILAIPLVLRRKKDLLEYRSPWSIEVEVEFGKGPYVPPAAAIENAVLRNALAVTLTTSKLSKKTKSLANPSLLYARAQYMFFSKPIVACGITKSSKYLLVKENEIAEEKIRVMKDKTPVSTSNT